jgi:hypothetical protein
MVFMVACCSNEFELFMGGPAGRDYILPCILEFSEIDFWNLYYFRIFREIYFEYYFMILFCDFLISVSASGLKHLKIKS